MLLGQCSVELVWVEYHVAESGLTIEPSRLCTDYNPVWRTGGAAVLLTSEGRCGGANCRLCRPLHAKMLNYWCYLYSQDLYGHTGPSTLYCHIIGISWVRWPLHTASTHRFLMGRLPLQGSYLWRHVLSTAPPFIWWPNLEICPPPPQFYFTAGCAVYQFKRNTAST
jgi:hypothetical protein